MEALAASVGGGGGGGGHCKRVLTVLYSLPTLCFMHL